MNPVPRYKVKTRYATAVFPVTHASVFERIRSRDDDTRRAAFDDLVTGYWRPAYQYVRVHLGLGAADAEDAVQGFFTIAFEKAYLEAFDPSRAHFRTFLRVCLDRFVANQRAAAHAGKRGGDVRLLSLDFPAAERDLMALPRVAGDAERFFHDETVRALFARAIERMRRQLMADGKAIVMTVFERHDVEAAPATTYRSIAAALDLTTAQVTNYLSLARRLFREAALAELRAIASTDEEFRRDARALFGATIDA